MANNKIIKDGLGVDFTTKTTETEGVNVPHVNVDTLPLPAGASTSARQDLILQELQLKANLTETQPVAPNVTRGAGNVDANTQRVTLANDGQSALALASIDAKSPALDASKQPVIASMTSGGHLSVTTNATGTTFNAFANQACKQLNISNQTGTVIEVQQGGAGVALQIPTGAFYTFFGITNANQLAIRRTDVSNTQVTVTARWEV